MICVLLVLPIISQAQTTDSNSVVKVNTTRTHIIVKGETLYSIARKNHCAVEQIKQLNPAVNFNKLKYGSTISIPIGSATAVEPSTNSGSARVKTLTETSVSSDVTGASGFFPMYHVVQTGETLTKIAMRYHQKVFIIRKWNHLTGNTILSGERLIVGRRMSSSSTQQAAVAATPYKHAATSDLIETTEKGIAKWDTGTYSSNGYLFGLCSVVPEGTVIKVTNLVNNETVVVKITGKLPPNDESENVLIKIPETAARQLNAPDEKFMVQLSYFVQPQLSLK
jgi:LysM repeat protein